MRSTSAIYFCLLLSFVVSGSCCQDSFFHFATVNVSIFKFKIILGKTESPKQNEM